MVSCFVRWMRVAEHLLKGVKTTLQMFDVLVPGCVQTACSVAWVVQNAVHVGEPLKHLSLANTQDTEVLLDLHFVYRCTTLTTCTSSLVHLYKLQMTKTWFDGVVCDRYRTHTGFLERSILLMIYICLVGTWGMKIVILYEICPLEEKGLGYENVK